MKTRHRDGTDGESTVGPTMKAVDVVKATTALAEPICDSEGMELVYVEYQREPAGRILRVFIDKPGGVRLTDCERFSRQFSDLLDVYLDSIGPYSLEVSSPGVDRPLGKASDFERFKGCEVRVRTSRPLDGQKNFKGLLLGLSEGKVKIRVDNRTVIIPHGEIQKARLVNFSGDYPCLSQTSNGSSIR